MGSNDGESATADQTTGHDGETARAGRGVLLMTGGKVYFILAGYSVQLLLPRLLGSPEAFGLYSSAMSVVSILNNVLIVATLQAMSKRVSEDPADAHLRLREGLWLQVAVGLSLGGGLFVAAPSLASVLRDRLLSPLFRIASVIVLSYAIYATLVGYLNGHQLFRKQALFDVGYATLRTTGILGVAALGYGVAGSISGFAIAAVIILIVALMVVGTGGSGPRLGPTARPTGQTIRAHLAPWLVLMAPLWLYQLCLNLTLQVDLTVLKRNVADLSLVAGLSQDAAAALASRYAGFYRAAQTFSFVPYQLIMSVALVVFPMISRATTLGDEQATRRYIQGALRFSLIVLCAVAAPVSGAAHGVMRIAYPDAYMAGSDALSVLSLGMAAFALFVVAATIMSGAGRPGTSEGIAQKRLLSVEVCNTVFVRHAGVGDRTLLAAACGTSVGTALTLCAMGVVVYHRFGAFVPWRSAVRVLIAAAIAFGVARSLPHDAPLSALLALVGGALAYLLCLIGIGEIGGSELRQLIATVARR